VRDYRQPDDLAIHREGTAEAHRAAFSHDVVASHARYRQVVGQVRDQDANGQRRRTQVVVQRDVVQALAVPFRPRGEVGEAARCLGGQHQRLRRHVLVDHLGPGGAE